MSAVSPDCDTTIDRPSWRQRLLAVAELGGDIDVDRQPGEALEPVFADQPGIEGGAAGGDRQAVERREVDVEILRHRRAPGGEVEVVGERVADDLGLLVDLLRHEVAVVALVDEHAGGERAHHRPLTGAPLASWIATPSRVSTAQSPSSR